MPRITKLSPLIIYIFNGNQANIDIKFRFLSQLPDLKFTIMARVSALAVINFTTFLPPALIRNRCLFETRRLMFSIGQTEIKWVNIIFLTVAFERGSKAPHHRLRLKAASVYQGASCSPRCESPFCCSEMLDRDWVSVDEGPVGS